MLVSGEPVSVIKVSDVGHRAWRLYAAAHLGHRTVGGEGVKGWCFPVVRNHVKP